jgi:hypothetical protein
MVIDAAAPIYRRSAIIKNREGVMQIHLHVHRWVIWWIWIGVVCGIVASVNILGRNLTSTQVWILIVAGAANWLLGGVICWASQAIKISSAPGTSPPVPKAHEKHEKKVPGTEYHRASDFLFPGGRQSILPWRH